MNKRAQAVVEALERQGLAGDIAGAKPDVAAKIATVRLRFDKVALRFVGDVQAALQVVVPDGKTIVFTITAPIRLASKTAAVLEDRLLSALVRRTARLDITETIHANQIRVRLLKGAQGVPKAIGFVHNPDSDPEVLFDVTQSLLRSAASSR